MQRSSSGKKKDVGKRMNAWAPPSPIDIEIAAISEGLPAGHCVFPDRPPALFNSRSEECNVFNRGPEQEKAIKKPLRPSRLSLPRRFGKSYWGGSKYRTIAVQKTKTKRAISTPSPFLPYGFGFT